MNYKWAPLLGKFQENEGIIVFKGDTVIYNEQPGPAIGNFICDQTFGGGTISADIEFTDVKTVSACEIIVWFDPSTNNFVSAGFGPKSLYSIRQFSSRWIDYALVGDRGNLQDHRRYHVEVKVSGQQMILAVDGVKVCSANLPFPLPQSQPGIWCQGQKDIFIHNYQVTRVTPTVFVVMQFTTPYNELYDEVIKKVCSEFELQAVRVDETFGPGIIIADIAKQILEAKIVIADITPKNPNVYYEVGFAHALNKPTILIAERPTELPFDVSSFRTLFYENSIPGKAKIEDGLRKHIQAILNYWYNTK